MFASSKYSFIFLRQQWGIATFFLKLPVCNCLKIFGQCNEFTNSTTDCLINQLQLLPFLKGTTLAHLCTCKILIILHNDNTVDLIYWLPCTYDGMRTSLFVIKFQTSVTLGSFTQSQGECESDITDRNIYILL